MALPARHTKTISVRSDNFALLARIVNRIKSFFFATAESARLAILEIESGRLEHFQLAATARFTCLLVTNYEQGGLLSRILLRCAALIKAPVRPLSPECRSGARTLDAG